jgi:ribosomal protein L40E
MGITPDAPAGLDIVLDRALQKYVARRLQSGSDLKRALALCAMGLTIDPRPPKPAGGGLEPDVGKTVVIRRPSKSAAEAAKPLAQPQPPVSIRRPDVIFCPTCTAENSKAATVCARCGVPLAVLAALGTRETGRRRSWWRIVLVSVLALALIVLCEVVLRP